MNTALDYIYWRGDLTFEQDPFNEIDALILSGFSYIDFNLLADEALASDKLTIHLAAELWDKADREVFMPTGYLLHKKAYEALTLAGSSKRFKDILIKRDIKHFSVEDESQFGATIFHYNGLPLFIGFEGTDLRSLSWKEDLQMSYLPQIPSQRLAAEVLEEHFEQYPYPVSIGGHSKGGNLAIYGAIFIETDRQKYLDKIYSFDSPGFRKSLLKNNHYKNIVDKIYSYVPQDAIIGLLMHKLEEQLIVYSQASDSRQHDLFSWEIQGSEFVSSELTDSALQIQELISQVYDELSIDELEHFSEALFKVIGDGEEDYIFGDRHFHLEKIPRIIIEFTNLSSESRSILLKVLRIFYRKRLELF